MSRILMLAAAAVLIATPAMALSVQAMPKNADGSARYAEPANPFANSMPQVTYGSGPYAYGPLGFNGAASRYGDNSLSRSIPAPTRESDRALQQQSINSCNCHSVQVDGLWVMRPADGDTNH